jgi:hypothetical protein
MTTDPVDNLLSCLGEVSRHKKKCAGLQYVNRRIRQIIGVDLNPNDQGP